MKEEKRHVGRPTNEEVKQRKRKKMMFILPIIILFLVMTFFTFIGNFNLKRLKGEIIQVDKVYNRYSITGISAICEKAVGTNYSKCKFSIKPGDKTYKHEIYVQGKKCGEFTNNYSTNIYNDECSPRNSSMPYEEGKQNSTNITVKSYKSKEDYKNSLETYTRSYTVKYTGSKKATKASLKLDKNKYNTNSKAIKPTSSSLKIVKVDGRKLTFSWDESYGKLKSYIVKDKFGNVLVNESRISNDLPSKGNKTISNLKFNDTLTITAYYEYGTIIKKVKTTNITIPNKSDFAYISNGILRFKPENISYKKDSKTKKINILDKFVKIDYYAYVGEKYKKITQYAGGHEFDPIDLEKQYILKGYSKIKIVVSANVDNNIVASSKKYTKEIIYNRKLEAPSDSCESRDYEQVNAVFNTYIYFSAGKNDVQSRKFSKKTHKVIKDEKNNWNRVNRDDEIKQYLKNNILSHKNYSYGHFSIISENEVINLKSKDGKTLKCKPKDLYNLYSKGYYIPSINYISSDGINILLAFAKIKSFSIYDYNNKTLGKKIATFSGNKTFYKYDTKKIDKYNKLVAKFDLSYDGEDYIVKLWFNVKDLKH